MGYNIDTNKKRQPDTAERGTIMSIFVVNLRTHGDWENGIEYGQQATLIVEGRTLKEVEEKAIAVYCENILEHYGNINNLDATYCDYTKTTEATCNTCGKCVCEWSITAEARRMKKDETYKDSYSGITHYYNGLYNGSTSNIISDIAFDPEYNKTEQPKAEATAETTEATEQPTEETAQTTEAMSITLTINMDENNELIETIEAYKIEVDFLRQMVAKALKAEAEARAEVRKLKQTIEDYKSIIEALQATAPPTGATAQTTEETAQTKEINVNSIDFTSSYPTAETTEATPPPTEATGKEVTGVTIREYRTYNNGNKVMIRHHYFYNADEIIDNYHATDPSYICKYKGLMFGKDDNDYYVSEFHYEEQYL